MRSARLIILVIVFGAISTVSTFAQADTGKVGVINTSAFTVKEGGITRYIAQQEKLNAEFKPVNDELNDIITKINALKVEIKNLQEAASKNPKTPIKQETIEAKAREHDRLVRQYNFKTDETKVSFSTRSQALLDPIKADIFKAIQEFAKEKGYVVIWDIKQLLKTNTILAMKPDTDVTEEFIKYYNARPAGTATK